jgi:membrane protein DedA with SNARE-associated domain
MIHQFIAYLVETISALGYVGIFLLMALESSFVPVPSELVMPPAGYLVQKGEMNFFLVVMAGAMGSQAGAYVNYYLAMKLGRPLLLKYGKYFLISQAKFVRIEMFFLTHGEVSTFIGRLLPVARHLISLPAGLARMNHSRFILYTSLGATIWVTILTYLGYLFGANEKLIYAYEKPVLAGVAAFCIVVIAGYVWYVKRAGALGARA